MKKYLICIVIISFIVSMMFIGSACKTEATPEEEVEAEGTMETEEAAEEVEAEEAEEEVEAEETKEEETVEKIEITDEPVTINIWSLSGAEDAILQAWAPLYMAENPNVTLVVTTQTSDFMRASGPISVASGAEELDIFWFWSNMGQSMAQKGLLVDLSDYYDKYGWWDKIKPLFKNAMTSSDGGVYFFGLDSPVIPMVWYNKDIFNEIGAEEPDTLEEMLQIARDSISSGYSGMTNLTGYWHFDMSALGAHFMSDEEKATIGMWASMSGQDKASNVDIWKNSKGLRDCLEYIKETGEEGIWAKDNNLFAVDESRTDFAEGNTAMHVEGSWMANLWANYSEDISNIGVFPFPEAKVPVFPGNALCVPAYVEDRSPEKIPVILDFFEHMLEPEYAKIIFENGNFSPTTLVDAAFVAENGNELFAEINGYIDTVGGETALHFGFTKPLEAAFIDVCARVSSGDMTVDEAIDFIYDVALQDVVNG